MQMLHQRSREERYPEELTIGWLSWLAGKMRINQNDVFYVDQMEPTWLANGWQRLVYFIFSCLLILLLLFVLNWSLAPANLPIIAAAGVVLGLLDAAYLTIQSFLAAYPRRGAFRNVLRMVSLSLFLFPLVLNFNQANSAIATFATISTIAPTIAMISASTLNRTVGEDIRVVERLAWSWRAAKRSFLAGFVVCFAIVLLAQWINPGKQILLIPGASAKANQLVQMLFMGTSIGLILAPFIGLIGGVANYKSSGMMLRAGKGTLTAARQVLLFGLAIGITVIIGCTIIIATMEIIVYQLNISYILDLVLVYLKYFGPSFVLVAVFLLGGADLIMHFTLRALLAFQRRTPFQYDAFLGYAVDRILLRRIGDGYLFVHNELQDYFATLKVLQNRRPKTPIPALSKLVPGLWAQLHPLRLAARLAKVHWHW
jgi:hypothetical protein